MTLVERNPAQRDGCSFENAGMLVTSHFVPLAAPGMVALGLKWMWNPASPFYVKPRLSRDLLDWGIKFWRAATPEHVRRAAPLLRDLSIASHRCFEELAALPGSDFGLVRKGLLMLCRTPHALDEEVRTAEFGRALGIASEVLDARQAAALDPGIRMDIAGAVYFPQDCHLSPDRFVAELQDRVAAEGVEFAWNTEVTGWRVEGGRTIRAATTRGGGEIEADEFVLCGGSWSPSLARELGLRLPMQAGKGYSLTLREAAAIAADLRDPDRGARGGHADGRRAALCRDDGNRRPQRGHQSGARARHHRGRVEVLSRVRAVGFRRRRAVARAAAVLAGRDAVHRPHREMREPLHCHRPRDDGHEPRSRSPAS